MTDNTKSTPFSDAQSFLIGDDGKIYFWITSKLKKLNEKWASAIVPLRFFNLIHEKHAYVLKHKSEPLQVLEYLQKNDSENYDALFLQSQLTIQMASAHTHVILRSIVLKALLKLSIAEAGRAEKASRRMLEICVSCLEEEIERIEKQKLFFEGESIYEAWWCFKEKWAKAEADILLFEDTKDKINLLENIRAIELDTAQDSLSEESKDLLYSRNAYLVKIDNKLSSLNRQASLLANKKVKKPEISNLRFIFQEDEIFEPFMKFLANREIVDSSFSWNVRDKSLAYQSKCICLIKSLDKKGYLIRKPTNKEIVLLCANNFRVSVSIDTVKKAKPSKYRGFLNEIPNSKHFSATKS